jgi:cyclase
MAETAKFTHPDAWQTGLIEVAAGAYAYIQAGGGAGISNAGFVLGPDHGVVIDTLATTPMARNFLGAIRSLTDRPIRDVLLTHHHVDHILGVQNFLPARVICHQRGREEILSNGMDLPVRWAKARPQHAAGLLGVRVCVPDCTFSDKLTLHVGDREAVFFLPGKTAHAVSDAMLYLPDAKVLYAGDIVFHGVVPAGFQGHIGNWIDVLRSVLEMDLDIIVPGHGPVCTKKEVAETLECLSLIYEGARRAFTAGQSPEEAIARLKLGPFAGWCDAEERTRQNVNRAYQEFRGELDAL